MNRRVKAVLIDTVAYHNRQCDFAGITSTMIPTFLRMMEFYQIPILSHPILDSEIRKHIKESQIVERAKSLCKAVRQSKAVLISAGFDPEEIMYQASVEKVENALLRAYEKYRDGFTMLSYGDAKEVFDDYFNARPPFSATGNKKAEFPDAFVIKGLLRYCAENPNAQILVVSDDSDWQKALSENSQINIVNTLKDAMDFLWPQLGDKSEFINQILLDEMPNIMYEIGSAAYGEVYSLAGIDMLEDIEITRVETTSIVGNMTALEVTDNTIILHGSASLSVDGVAEYLDEDRSIWDREDHAYYFEAYSRMHFSDASADLECEVHLELPADGTMTPIEIKDVRVTNKWDICIDLSEAKITVEDISNYGEDDWCADQAEALEGYYRH